MAGEMGVGATLRQQWQALGATPEGKRRFSDAVGMLAPYSGSIQPEVLELESGRCRVQMQDRKTVRNHLDSIHAIALVNLAELTSGLAMLYGSPDDARGIITGLSIEYMKKARGTIVGECQCDVPASNEEREYEFDVMLRDAQGDAVAQARVRWLVGPR